MKDLLNEFAALTTSEYVSRYTGGISTTMCAQQRAERSEACGNS